MNWDKFKNNNLSDEFAFETFCNQIFEIWLYETYKDQIEEFRVVNGSGGDGGVESYCKLKSGEYIGLQAKYFRTAIQASQINQIRKSILTALNVRQNITKYIVCVPRNLSSKKANTKNDEETKWKSMVSDISEKFKNLEIQLWNSNTLLNQIQKPNAIGIKKFWFENTTIFNTTVTDSFNRAKSSWIQKKYVPELNKFGTIESIVSRLLFEEKIISEYDEKIDAVDYLCNQVIENVDQLINAIAVQQRFNVGMLKQLNNDIKKIINQNDILKQYLKNLKQQDSLGLDKSIYEISDIDKTIKYIETLENEFPRHVYDIITALNSFCKYDFNSFYNEMDQLFNSKIKIILGAAGTGKTHGVTAIVERLLKENYHVPLLIDAKTLMDGDTWKNILIRTLRISDNWDEEELWVALLSLANCNKVQKIDDYPLSTPKVLIVVDAIDESSHQNLWKEKINEAKYIAEKYPSVRFIFTSRPFVFSVNENNYSLDYVNLSNSGDVSVAELFDNYLKKYNIEVINKDIVKCACSTPFSLKLFCDLNQGKLVNLNGVNDVTITKLIQQKILKLEEEFSKMQSVSINNQYIQKTMVELTKIFVGEEKIERIELVKILAEKINIDIEISNNIVDMLSNYGILGSEIIKANSLLESNKTYYYKGTKGYFDYYISEEILNEYKEPTAIEFSKIKTRDDGLLEILGQIVMQRYMYLLTDNSTIASIYSQDQIDKLSILILRNADENVATKFTSKVKTIMSKDIKSLFLVINNLILPLSKNLNHPLNIKFLDDYLSKFKKPTDRDLYWSYYGFNKINFKAENDNYLKLENDSFDGLPTFYAWTLSFLNNSIREKTRNNLLKWAIKCPEEFVKLFYKFSKCNDPQIVEEMYSILLCCLCENCNIELTKKVCDWIKQNVLSPEVIDLNRNMAIRYYCVSILKKSLGKGIITDLEFKDILPPYRLKNYDIKLYRDALRADKMNGYKQIHYDLARYVLVDHIERHFFNNNVQENHCFQTLLENVSEKNDIIENISIDAFVISAAYQYIVDIGVDKKHIEFDKQLKKKYYPATHGSKSNIMAICEKYVWQARKMITTFLADRIPIKIENDWLMIDDYKKIDEFYIPSQDINLINPHDTVNENSMLILDKSELTVEFANNTKTDDFIKKVNEKPEIKLKNWIMIDNKKRDLNIDSDKLISLYDYFDYNDKSGLNTIIAINSIIVNIDELGIIKESIKKFANADPYSDLSPSNWSGTPETSCYITPKEACWFSWIKHKKPSVFDKLKGFDICVATEHCTYNNDIIGEIDYVMLSSYINKLLKIQDSNGYFYKDVNSTKKAEFYLSGYRNKKYQEKLIVDYKIVEALKNERKQLLWITLERRRPTMKTREKFKDLYLENNIYNLAYFVDNELKVERIYPTKIVKNECE